MSLLSVKMLKKKMLPWNNYLEAKINEEIPYLKKKLLPYFFQKSFIMSWTDIFLLAMMDSQAENNAVALKLKIYKAYTISGS